MLKQNYFDRISLETNWEIILKKLGYTAKKKSSGLIMKCIFHSEGTASLFLYSNGSGYRCFGCGRAGATFSFVKSIKGTRGAIYFFRKHFGICP